jgi:hypothetical protein
MLPESFCGAKGLSNSEKLSIVLIFCLPKLVKIMKLLLQNYKFNTKITFEQGINNCIPKRKGK